MRLLITLASLGDVGGVQTWVLDCATWLLARGHTPIVYAPQHGEAAMQLHRHTVAVTDDLATIAVKPDLIVGNSAVETMSALLHFGDTPALFVCHGWRGAAGRAPRFPRLLRYIAVDDTCADRLLLQEGIPPETLTVLLNSVDLQRFAQRAPLPPRPRRALIFSNTAHELNHVPAIREACGQHGIEVDLAGLMSGTAVSEPETILGNYDLVFAKARCALEAMASGAAVVICDAAGLGGMVRAADVERLRRLNFGIRTQSMPVTAEALSREIAAYDADDARKVSDVIRASAGTETAFASLFELCEKVIAEPYVVDRAEEGRAAARFLRDVTRADSELSGRFSTAYQAAHRVLGMRVVGPMLTRIAKLLTRKGRVSTRP